MKCAKCKRPFANEGDFVPMFPRNGDPVTDGVCRECAEKIVGNCVI